MKPDSPKHKTQTKSGSITGLALLIAILLIFAAGEAVNPAFAQSYYFQITEATADVFWNKDGTVSFDYYYTFAPDTGTHPIDFIDLSLPPNFDEGSIQADVNGQPVDYISRSEYQGDGTGVAIALGSQTIEPGETGELHIWVPVVRDRLYPDDTDPNYVSGTFAPAWFDPDIIYGESNLTVAFHLPPGVQTEEPRWHSAPSGFSEEPERALDSQGNVLYVWKGSATLNQNYIFGASFPASYVPSEAIVQGGAGYVNGGETGGVSDGAASFIAVCLPFAIIAGVFILIFAAGYAADKKRKLQYLPPKIAIEGHGIKRGLTSIEAAILMEEPMDKILTMILFATIKKNAATVQSQDPLTLQIADPLPADLRDYELEFLEAFQATKKREGKKAQLQKMMVNLVKSVSQKMKGFSRKETIDYYRDIIQRAWAQVEAANTPEVKSAKYDEVMEWTMLDRKYEDRTRDVFRTGPVFVPVWWPRYDPSYGGGTVIGSSPRPSTSPSSGGGGGGVNMPTLPGSAFAGSIITGVQDFARNTVGSISDFTGGVTKATNPPPPPSRSSSHGGGGRSGGCACACACAGCACACAGGGR